MLYVLRVSQNVSEINIGSFIDFDQEKLISLVLIQGSFFESWFSKCSF
jgi:hypothetical protein